MPNTSPSCPAFLSSIFSSQRIAFRICGTFDLPLIGLSSPGGSGTPFYMRTLSSGEPTRCLLTPSGRRAQCFGLFSRVLLGSWVRSGGYWACCPWSSWRTKWQLLQSIWGKDWGFHLWVLPWLRSVRWSWWRIFPWFRYIMFMPIIRSELIELHKPIFPTIIITIPSPTIITTIPSPKLTIDEKIKIIIQALFISGSVGLRVPRVDEVPRHRMGWNVGVMNVLRKVHILGGVRDKSIFFYFGLAVYDDRYHQGRRCRDIIIQINDHLLSWLPTSVRRWARRCNGQLPEGWLENIVKGRRLAVLF